MTSRSSILKHRKAIQKHTRPKKREHEKKRESPRRTAILPKLSQFNVPLFKEEQLYESLKPALGLLESPINLYRSAPAAVPLMGEEVTCAQTKVTAILLLEGEEQR